MADGFTRQLSSSLFRRFKEGLNLLGSGEKNAEGGAVRKLLRLDGEKVEKVAAALVGLGSLANLPVTAAVDSKASGDGWDWFPLILLGLAMCLVKMVEVIGREGWRMIQVERLREQAQLARKTEDKEGGWCIPCEGEEKVVNPGEHALVRTGLRIRAPRSTQGRFNTGLDVFRKGGGVGEGTISPDCGEEFKRFCSRIPAKSLFLSALELWWRIFRCFNV